ncbi:hypothetical protein K435DRAFT_667945 [Dendrothele bispora CBS 962.96]|uniref:CxC2-like cysteine cluster KDZ transposase-associated domain-containing protein n=1 Tax=Dendrothele bispora (strain CBS 962.96) TaxID=1314807 RepID=A0A4V4HFE9_DENBC|nr:hypothetical protein K435DRAFT_667945 [Dendrothele bispora CBS 962.96]
MRPFLGRLGSFVRYLLHKEEPKGLLQRCECGLDVRDTQCRDCFHNAPMCRVCFMLTHKQTPFHWARVWSPEKSCFVQQDISEFGYGISLGHNGDECPLATRGHFCAIRIVDINGIHETQIQYCHCSSRVDQFQQLMDAGLFPATTTNPETAVTFNLLETFNIDSLVSKKSAYDFATALRRRTNPDFPDRVPNIHPQFLRVLRVWRALQMFKQSGQGHGIDDAMQEFVPGWRGRNLIQLCLACPQVGFNMEEEVDEDEWKHVETLFLSADGHFGLQRKSKVEDPDDVALTGDMGLFPEERVYAEYVSKVQDSTEKTTCAHLKAANMQNKAKFIGLVISGVIAVTCARHNFFLHGGMVNLTRGEKFNLTDLALAGVLSFLLLVRHIVLTYDIACQYDKNLVKRFKENFIGTPFEHLGLDEIVDRFLCLVPKMHLKGHIPNCQYEYSLNFTPNVGRTYGEGIEGIWAEAKQAGGMTQEMNAGHRIDTLNALQNDWNIGKLQNLFSSLYRQLTNARSQARRKVDFYKGQCKLNGQARVEKWLKMSVLPTRKGDHVESVYRLKEDKELVPGQGQIYRQMLDAETEEIPNTSGKKGSPISKFLNTGLKIQSTQRTVRANAQKKDQTDTDKAALAKHRAALRGSLKRWREEQEVICPSIMDLMLEQRFDYPEREILFLASDLSPEQREEHQMEYMAECEMKLRRGEANDAIRTLRTELRHLDALWAMKNKKGNHNVGTERNLRSLKDIQNSEDKVRRLATKYRECRVAMVALGMSAADAAAYPILKDEDLCQKNVVQPHALGEGSTTESWLWVFGTVGSLSLEERNEFDMECK